MASLCGDYYMKRRLQCPVGAQLCGELLFLESPVAPTGSLSHPPTCESGKVGKCESGKVGRQVGVEGELCRPSPNSISKPGRKPCSPNSSPPTSMAPSTPWAAIP